MKRLLYITSIASVLAAGCTWERTAPSAQGPAWDRVQLHETADGAAVHDLSVRTDGELSLVDSRGDGGSSQGLLAGEKLETLARLIDRLPPSSYASSAPCTSDGFVVSVTRGGEVLTYESGSCDQTQPAGLSDLHQTLDGLIAQLQSGNQKPNPIAFTVLSEGTSCAIHQARQEVIRDRDALMGLLREMQPGRPVGIARADFSRQMVVAVFAGDKPTGGYALTADGANESSPGWLQIHLREVAPSPDARCAGAPGTTQPFVLIAVDSADASVSFESTVVVTRCD